LFCRVIEKREEHQRNVQIYTIPETVPTIADSCFGYPVKICMVGDNVDDCVARDTAFQKKEEQDRKPL